MFSQIFFILLTLVLITFTPETDVDFWTESPSQALLWATRGYLGLLALICFQTYFLGSFAKRSLQALWWVLINLEIYLFLGIYHFGLGAQRFFLQSTLHSFNTPYSLVSLILYFFALGWAHFCFSYFQLHHSYKNALKKSSLDLLFLIPFCIPFIAIRLLLDGFSFFFPDQANAPPINEFLLWGLGFLFVLLILIVFPAVVMICWRCLPLGSNDLNDHLEKRCSSLHFRHAGLKILSVMPHSFTAGIIGIVPWFRYLFFTPSLVQQFPPEEVEAILIHEIGHHHYRHLFYYPFIMLGMILSGSLLLIGLEKLFYFDLESLSQEIDHFIILMSLFILYAVFLALYFRLIFGFFSRLFERQADLHIFATSLSPNYLIQALDRLGIVTGYTHFHPNWHHFGLQDRIEFLNAAIQDPSLIQKHHQRVKKWLIGYFFVMLFICLFLYLFI